MNNIQKRWFLFFCRMRPFSCIVGPYLSQIRKRSDDHAYIGVICHDTDDRFFGVGYLCA